ncbi:hypothetical protein D2T29_12435 [Sinirhodobacter populi]|uniref:Uncharacterized protein n=1 Tax=Paenirhodobacter populi TaxID=2306993 RepID=A0A443KCV8_9RHOB|nr:hypothetical protein [Sinirhodobacter populi]RWR30472.1 hypothetical protein D2T29_12435 [Sinirhodobacter populi]
MTNMPVKPLPDDAVDMAAKAIAAEVAHHIKTMYPGAAEAVAWESCKRSLAGVIRNGMKRLGDAAERGEMESEIKAMRSQRSREDAMRRDMAEASTPAVVFAAIQHNQSN